MEIKIEQDGQEYELIINWRDIELLVTWKALQVLKGKHEEIRIHAPGRLIAINGFERDVEDE